MHKCPNLLVFKYLYIKSYLCCYTACFYYVRCDASSPYIHPVGFCEEAQLTLITPPGKTLLASFHATNITNILLLSQINGNKMIESVTKWNYACRSFINALCK